MEEGGQELRAPAAVGLVHRAVKQTPGSPALCWFRGEDAGAPPSTITYGALWEAACGGAERITEALRGCQQRDDIGAHLVSDCPNLRCQSGF